MDLFNLLQPPEDDSFYMRMAAVNQMSQMMHSLMMNPLANMGMDTLGLMGMQPQAMLGPPVGVPALRPAVPGNPWMDMFSPGAGGHYQTMSLMGGDASIHSYCSSTMMSMSTGPDGRPMVYQATSSTRSGPGGVREVQKSVCDSMTGTKKMQIGRHIGNRGHVIEKEQNYISGEREEREDFINIEEEEAEKFTEEFQYRTQMNRGNAYTNPRAHAISAGQPNVPGTGAMLALPSSSQTYPPAGRTTPSYQAAGRTTPTYTPAGRTTPTYPPAGRTTPTYQPAGRTTPTYTPPGRTTPTYQAAGRTTPTRGGWNDSTHGSTWYPSQSNADQSTTRSQSRPRKVSVRSKGDPHPYSCEKMRKRDHSHDEVGGPTSSKTQKTHLPNYENID